ncbi:MAG: CerR family C-terminal domain-containing protein [Gemmataceae bacterium]
MSNVSDIAAEVPTKQRLLDAAQAIFAAKGYEAASVADICDFANANRAAISFHFGGKERLYIESVKAAHLCCIGGEPFPEWPAGTPATERLRGFIRTMVRRMVVEATAVESTLMMREMIEPTAACFEVVREYIRPVADILRGILTELLPNADSESVFLAGFSIVGQCLYYKQNRPVSRILMGDTAYESLSADRIADHISAFTLRGLGVTP